MLSMKNYSLKKNTKLSGYLVMALEHALLIFNLMIVLELPCQSAERQHFNTNSQSKTFA